ncbi:hypothetical protein DH2020_037864 [Rehmannia glutinosa]|uniref:Protein ARV n=1 Tax=Rehmannia glutinosa TaxID=99300 RepID=A0ABR0V1G0_REHGL
MASCGSSSEAEGTTDFRCVQCGFPIKTLYIQYSPGNIRLMRCEKLQSQLLVEVGFVIPYFGSLYPLFNKSVALTALDRMWVLNTNEKEGCAPASVASLLLDFGKMLTGVIFGNLIFLSVVFHATRKFLSASAGLYGWKHMLLVVLFSSYFKIFLMAMMVWEFPSSVVFIIDIFVISSNTVALKEMVYECVDLTLKITATKIARHIIQMQETRLDDLCWLVELGICQEIREISVYLHLLLN